MPATDPSTTALFCTCLHIPGSGIVGAGLTHASAQRDAEARTPGVDLDLVQAHPCTQRFALHVRFYGPPQEWRTDGEGRWDLAPALTPGMLPGLRTPDSIPLLPPGVLDLPATHGVPHRLVDPTIPGNAQNAWGALVPAEDALPGRRVTMTARDGSTWMATITSVGATEARADGLRPVGVTARD